VPEHVDVDIAHLEVGDVLRLVDIPAIENVTFLDDPHETVIATVSMPRGYAEIEEADAAAAEEAAEGAAPEAEAAEDGEPSDSNSEE
jgi:large subunit ribosomal protein L25